MHLLCSLVVAVLALFPASDDAVADLYHRWMRSYEMHLMAQIEENFRNEQKAGEEAKRDEHEEPAVLEEHDQSHAPSVPAMEASTPVENESTIVTPLYQVDGYVPDEALQTYLHQKLCEAGIGWFFPYSICLIAQESTWNPLAENPNGEDKGLLQYKIKFVPWMDWRNPYVQIDYFVAQMANRSAAGCTVSVMISRHNTSDYGEYNQVYVDAVMQHSTTLIKIR